MDASQQEFVPCTQDSEVQVLHFVDSSTTQTVPNFPSNFSLPRNPFVATRSSMAYPIPQHMFSSIPNPVVFNTAPPTSSTSFAPRTAPTHSIPFIPSAAPPAPPSSSEQTTSTIILPQPQITSKKRGRPLKKNLESTKKKKTDIDCKVSNDNSPDEDDNAPRMWPEHHIVALLHARCELIDEFLAPPKQGVDLWSKVHTKVIAMCPDFKKDTKACRKKFQNVFKQYQSDITWNGISGNERRESCAHFKLLDSYFGERANVKKHVHACAIDVEDNSQVQDDVVKTETQVKKETPEFCSSRKKKTKSVALSLMEEVLQSGKDIKQNFQASPRK